MVNLLDLFPPRPSSTPSLGDEPTLEVFHSLVEPDEDGWAFVAMRRPAPHAAPYSMHDDYSLREIANTVWHNHGDGVIDGTLAYTWAMVTLPRGVVAVYVTPLAMRRKGEGLH